MYKYIFFFLIANFFFKKFYIFCNFKEYYLSYQSSNIFFSSYKEYNLKKNILPKKICESKTLNIKKNLVQKSLILKEMNNKTEELKKNISKRIDKNYKEVYYSNKYCKIIPNYCKEYRKKVIKFLLIVIIKNENMYIREFIEHYFFLGIDNIIICDNNDLDGEHTEFILNDFIKSGFIKILNYRGKRKYQVLSYQQVYLKYLNYYDWFMFFDADEYLILPNHKNIHHLFNTINYDEFDIIHVNWIYYDDNELIYYDNRPLQIRFNRPKFNYNNKNKNNKMDIHIKSIIRNGFVNFEWKGNPHTPSGLFKCCDVNGKKINNSPFNQENPAIISNLSVPFLKHFCFKTIEEYFKKKLPRGSACGTGGDNYETIATKKIFFNHNNWNKEKDNIASILINEFFINKYRNKTKAKIKLNSIYGTNELKK